MNLQRGSYNVRESYKVGIKLAKSLGGGRACAPALTEGLKFEGELWLEGEVEGRTVRLKVMARSKREIAGVQLDLMVSDALKFKKAEAAAEGWYLRKPDVQDGSLERLVAVRLKGGERSGELLFLLLA